MVSFPFKEPEGGGLESSASPASLRRSRRGPRRSWDGGGGDGEGEGIGAGDEDGEEGRIRPVKRTLNEGKDNQVEIGNRELFEYSSTIFGSTYVFNFFTFLLLKMSSLCAV